MTDWINEYQKFTATPWSPTTLKPPEEQKFRNWLQSTQLFNSVKSDIAAENKIPVDKLDNQRVTEIMLQSPDYDYRGAYKAGIKEVISPYDNRPHWPSSTDSGQMLKDPSHPTAWMEFFMRQYGVDPNAMGLDTLEKAKNWSLSTQKPENPFYKDPFSAPDYSIQ
jgi:hypothetical protein